MGARPWMPFYFADYLADTGHLTPAEHGAYLLLIAHYWTNGKLPDDEAAIARITRLTPHQWKKSIVVLRSLFLDGWRHKRIDHEIAQAIEKSRTNSANAKRRHSERTAKPMRSHTQSQSQSQSQEDDGEARRAHEVATEVGKLCGHESPLDWPIGFYGAPRIVEKWLNAGWKSEIILDAVRETLARKRDGPPENINYFEKPIAKAHARHAAPLPEIKGALYAKAGNVIPAADRLIERINEFNRPAPEPGIRGGTNESPVRLLSKG